MPATCSSPLSTAPMSTAARPEIGYAFARGKRIIGYRGDFRLAADNIGSTINLQVEYFVRASGGEIATSLTELTTVLALPCDDSHKSP